MNKAIKSTIEADIVEFLADQQVAANVLTDEQAISAIINRVRNRGFPITPQGTLGSDTLDTIVVVNTTRDVSESLREWLNEFDMPVDVAQIPVDQECTNALMTVTGIKPTTGSSLLLISHGGIVNIFHGHCGIYGHPSVGCESIFREHSRKLEFKIKLSNTCFELRDSVRHMLDRALDNNATVQVVEDAGVVTLSPIISSDKFVASIVSKIKEHNAQN